MQIIYHCVLQTLPSKFALVSMQALQTMTQGCFQQSTCIINIYYRVTRWSSVGKIIASLTLCREKTSNIGVHGVQDLSDKEKSQNGFPFLSNGSVSKQKLKFYNTQKIELLA